MSNALLGDEARFFFSLSPHLLCIAGLDGYFKTLNPAWQQSLGFTPEELLSRPHLEFVHAEDRARTSAAWSELARGKATLAFENRCLTQAGTYKRLAWNASSLPDRGLVWAVVRDASDSKAVVHPTADSPASSARGAASEQLRNERFVNALLDGLQVGIVACDERGVLTVFNQVARGWHDVPPEPLPAERWAEHYGWRRADGTPLDLRAIPLYRALEGELVSNVEMIIASRLGELRTVLVSGRPIVDGDGNKLGAVTAMIDITERKCLEQQFRHAQKMEAVGRLAGGVAHDFNNLLTIITGYGQLLRRNLESGSPLQAYVEEVLKSGERAASLTRQLLAFSRRQEFAPRLLDLNTVVSSTEKMLKRLIGEDLELTTVLASGLGMCKADPGQIEQVIMNLAVNARDAMPRGGSLTLETANADLDGNYARGHIPVKPGAYVMLAVSDTGCGMDAATQAHLFEPFFTTKEAGKGTGLGLATVYGIVKQHEGNIWVYSELGHGTTFKIYLPRVHSHLVPADRPHSLPREVSGSETILLVEDEASVRSLIAKLLRSLGYTVLEASRADEALKLSAQYAHPVHLILSDLVLPQMSGSELVHHLRPSRPETRVLFISGYTEEALNRRGFEGGAAFLAKPFTEDALAAKVREVLEEGKASS